MTPPDEPPPADQPPPADDPVPSEGQGTTRAMRRSFRAFYVLTMSLTMGYGSVLTLLAELKEEFGFSTVGVGLIAGAGFFAGLVAQLLLAPQADRGHTKKLLGMGILSAVAATAWMTIADELWQFVLARLLLGAGSGAVVPAIRRIIITADPDNVGENLGRVTAFDIGGFVLGPVVAAIALEIGGIRAPFIALCVWYVLLTPYAFLLRVDDTVVGGGAGMAQSLRRLLGLQQMRAALGLAVAFYMAVGAFEALWAVMIDDLGGPTWLIGVTLSVFTLPMVVLAPIGGKYAARHGVTRVVPWSVGVAAGCMVAYGLFGELRSEGETAVLALVAISFFSLVHAVADSFTLPANQVAVALASPPELVATGQGLFSATGLVVAIVATTGGSAVYEAGGPFIAWISGAVVMFAGLAYALRAGLPQPRTAPAAERGSGGEPSAVGAADD